MSFASATTCPNCRSDKLSLALCFRKAAQGASWIFGGVAARTPGWSIFWMILVLVFGWGASNAHAQLKKGGLGLGFGLDAPPETSQPASLTATYTLAADGKTGTVSIHADLAEGFHLYSTTQPPGGPLKTKISLDSKLVKVTGPFKSNSAPHISSSEVWPGVPIEEHEVQVTWTAPFEVLGDLKSGSVALPIRFEGLACTAAGQCIPVEETLSASSNTGKPSTNQSAVDETSGGIVADSFAPPKSFSKPSLALPKSKESRVSNSGASLRPEDCHATLSGLIESAVVAPGGETHIVFEFVVDDGYHIYPFIADEKSTNFRTLIVPMEKSGLQYALPQTDSPLIPDALDPSVKEHTGTVKWRVPVRVPSDAQEGPHTIKFGLGFLTCKEGSCDPPTGATLEGALTVGKQDGTAAPAALTPTPATFKLIASQEKLASWQDFEAGARQALPNDGQIATRETPPATAGSVGPEELQKGQVTLMSLCLALLGGVIMNFMPCVLPVIGLKVMSFVEQSGSNRSEIIKLNLAYVLGILTVMWVLATITITLGNAFGWGEQFTYLEFKVFLAALVLAMALSFLGVWEIPIPGFATSYKSNQLMQKEGVVGAFAKGLLTTILATPCSAPFLGVVFGLTLTLSPVGVLVIYTFVGLGIGLPFLLLCVWPDAIRILPKPGAWMETLKEVLAFPLLLTVVYLVASIGSEHRVATLSMLIAVWFACWLIGKVPAYAESSSKAKAWGAGISIIAFWTVASFFFFGPYDSELPWQPYSQTTLSAHRAAGKTVMVDFTANWCFNCQVNTRVAIERPGVAEIIHKNSVVPLLADWTDRSPEIGKKLKELNSNAIPLLAIYPADPKAEPIILRDLITEKMLIEALKQAGPSRTPGRLTAQPVVDVKK